MLELRDYQSDDLEELLLLFYHTVHHINIHDYSIEQCDAWADGNADRNAWNSTLISHHTLVAVEQGMIVGFGDMDDSGYLDHLYVHKAYQGKGIATMLCDALELACKSNFYLTHASITARPFFSSRGYYVVCEQVVQRHGIWLTNYKMKKARNSS